MASKNLLVLDEKAVASNRVKPSYMQKQGGASNGSADKTKSYDSPLILKPDSVPSYKPVQTPELDKATGNETPWYERVRNTLEIGTAKALDAVQLGMLSGEANLFEAAGKVAEKVGAAGGRDAVNKSPFDWLYDKADEARKEYETVSQRAYDGVGNVGKFALQGVEGVSGLATDVAASSVTGLSSLDVMTAKTFGGSAYDAEQEGATLDEAILYGAGSAAKERILAKLLNGVSKVYGKSAANDFLTGLIDRAAADPKAIWALNRVASASSEFVEGTLSPILDPALKAIYDKGKAAKERYLTKEGRKELGKEAVYSGLLEAIVGLAGDLATDGISSYPGKQPETKQEQTSPLIVEEQQKQEPTQPLNRSQANKILDDPAKKSAFEKEYGVKLTGSKSDQAKTIMELTQKRAEAEVSAAQPSNPVADVLAGESKTAREQERTGVDNKQTLWYGDHNNEQTGGMPNVGTGSAEDLGTGVAGVQEGVGDLDSGWRKPTDGVGDSSVVRISPELNTAYQNSGVVPVELRDSTTDSAAFSYALSAARDSDASNGWAVTPKSAEELDADGVRTMMTADGGAGAGVTQDGDIVAVFKNKVSGPPKALHSILPAAIEAGGCKLDCYGPVLAGLYSQYGFVPVCRVEFNPDYANPGWTPDKGTPDIYFMVYTGKNGADAISNFGAHKVWTKADLDALPFYGKDAYDEAYAYRDGLLPEQRSVPQNSPLVKETPAQQSNPVADVLLGEEPQPGQKRSQTESNTIHARDEANQAPEEATPELYYTPMSEEESLAAAQARLDAGVAEAVEVLRNSANWSNVDLDTAMLVQDALAAEARQTNNWDAYEAWRETVQAHGTEIGRSMQAFAKWSRAGRTALAEVSDYLRTLDISKERRDKALSKISGFCERLDAVDKTDSASIKQLILDMNDARGTGTIIKSRLGKLLDKQNADYLHKVAKAQAVAMAHDYAPVDPGRALKSWQAIAQLLKITTTARNIGGNEVFGTVDALLGNTVGQAIDAMVSQVTGVKSVPVNNRWLSSAYRKAASDAINKSMLEIALDVDMGSVGTKYDPNTRAFRMSGNPLERFASRLSQLLSYALNTTDQMARGGIEAETQRSLGSKNKGAVEAEKIGEVGEQMADYELFQNKSQIAQASQGLHDTFNLIGVGGKVENGKRRGGFGAGDAVMPWSSVPANLGVKPIEMSPAGIVSGGIKLTKLMLDAKKTGKVDIKAQNKAVMEIARGMSGVPLAMLFAELAAQGLIQKSDDEDDYDVTNARKAEGRYDTQWNLSASLRHLTGGDATWQEDDTLVSLNWLQPINAFMEIGALFNDLKDDEDATIWDYTKAYANGSIKAFMDMPVVQGLQDMVSTFQYADSDSMVDRLGESLKSGAVGFVTGLMPGIVSNAAQAIDPYQRDTSGDTFGEQLGNKMLNNIPFASQNLPEKLDVFGNPMVNENRAFDVANSLVLPGAVNEYAPSEVVDTLDRVYEATGSSNFYPDYKAPATFDYDGVEYELSTKEKRAWTQTFGKAYTDLVTEANANDLFNDLSADRQAAVLSEIRSCAMASAREELVSGRGDKFENEYAKAMALSDPITYFSTKAAFTSAADPDRRNYAEIDKALSNYGSLDEATRKLLDSGNNTSVMDKLYEAKQSGVSVKTWYKAKDAVSELEPLPGNTGVKTYQQMQAVLDTVGARDADVIIKQYFDSTSLMPRKYDLLREAGVPAKKIVKFYEIQGRDGIKKQEIIDYFKKEAPEELRMSEGATEKIYKLFKLKEKDLDDWSW